MSLVSTGSRIALSIHRSNFLLWLESMIENILFPLLYEEMEKTTIQLSFQIHLNIPTASSALTVSTIVVYVTFNICPYLMRIWTAIRYYSCRQTATMAPAYWTPITSSYSIYWINCILFAKPDQKIHSAKHNTFLSHFASLLHLYECFETQNTPTNGRIMNIFLSHSSCLCFAVVFLMFIVNPFFLSHLHIYIIFRI